MKKSIRSTFLSVLCTAILLSGCAAPAASTPAPTSPAEAAETEATQAPTAEVSSLPGVETVPLDQLADSIPWLPIDTSMRPNVYYYLFNMSKPPFNNLLVRKAFVAATDRDVILRIAEEFDAINPRPATSLTPPETLGRDLYREVGISFHPADAREFLTQAGYSGENAFPPVTLMVSAGRNDFNPRVGEAMVQMWQLYLGVEVTLEVITDQYFQNAQSGDIYMWGWGADYNDPDNFLLENFRSGGPNNFSFFANAEFDRLVDEAADATDPSVRQELYIEAERLLCEEEVALIPLFHSNINVP